MAVRNVKKDKKGKNVKPEKPVKSNSKRSSRANTPDDHEAQHQALVDDLHMISPVVVIEDVAVEVPVEDQSQGVIESDKPTEVDLSEAVDVLDETDDNIDEVPQAERPIERSPDSNLTIQSLHPSPARPIFGGDDPMEGANSEEVNHHESLQASKSASGGFFSRIFGGFFGRRTVSIATPPPLSVARLAPTRPVLEVIHVFQNPGSALGHEGLMKRSKRRLARASIRQDGEVVMSGDDIPSVPVSSIPSHEKVVLLRQVLTPRHPKDHPYSQEVIIEKASSRPDLWIFVPYRECKKVYPTELLDYLSRRCAWPDSANTSPIRVEDQEGQPQEGGMATPPVVNGSPEVPRETPMNDDLTFSDLPPNSIDAPQRPNPVPMDREIPPFTPLTLPTPPAPPHKSEDFGEHEREEDEKDVEIEQVDDVAKSNARRRGSVDEGENMENTSPVVA